MTEGLVGRLRSQLEAQGAREPLKAALEILTKRGHLDADGNLTEAGRAREVLGAEGRAKDRAAKRGSRPASDFEYDRGTNAARLRPRGGAIMIYILAGNGAEAEKYAEDGKFDQGTYLIVHAGTTRKRGPTDFLATVGTWRERPDAGALEIALIACGFPR